MDQKHEHKWRPAVGKESLSQGWPICSNCKLPANSYEEAFLGLIEEMAAHNTKLEKALWDGVVPALRVLLDQVDYTTGACTLTEMVGAVLPKEIIEKARYALAALPTRE